MHKQPLQFPLDESHKEALVAWHVFAHSPHADIRERVEEGLGDWLDEHLDSLYAQERYELYAAFRDTDEKAMPKPSYSWPKCELTKRLKP